MNCRLFSQHENYTTESQIVKLIFRIKISYRFGTICVQQTN